MMSTLASVVDPSPELIADWKSQIAPPDHPLLQFHTKFWGVKEDRGHVNNLGVDDILPDCHVLDIDIQGVQSDKIWVRADYIRMFKFAEVFYAENESNYALSPCLVITGQPGIGKFLVRSCTAHIS